MSPSTSRETTRTSGRCGGEATPHGPRKESAVATTPHPTIRQPRLGRSPGEAPAPWEAGQPVAWVGCQESCGVAPGPGLCAEALGPGSQRVGPAAKESAGSTLRQDASPEGTPDRRGPSRASHQD